MTENAAKKCLFCGSLLNGRSDKKYCDDNCRNNHHYQMRKNEDNTIVKIINNSLLNNREILQSINKRKTIVKKQFLLDKHFDFEFITNVYKTRKGSEYKVVYDYAYKFINEEDIVLLRIM